MKITKPFLAIPIGYAARGKKLCFYNGSDLVLELDAPVDAAYPDYVQYVDVARFMGEDLTVFTDPEIDVDIKLTDKIPVQEFYREKYRPQAHFSAKHGWINDPNGLVFDGERYHLFYQHNPYSHQWSNMHWGHAVSTDLIHWDEQALALAPDALGAMFSGSAVMDRENRTGLKENENDVLLLFYTAAGGSSLLSKGKPFTQCMAYSTDNGKTFRKYAGNPVVEHIEAENRDPKVVFVPEISAYVMALYIDDNRYALLSSSNFFEWKFLQELSLPGDSECPDLYPLYLDGDPKQKRWVFSGASDRYLVGDFKSGKFRPLKEAKRLHYGRNSYAAQTFSDVPKEDGRRLRIAWNTTQAPNVAFCGSMNIPCEMELKTFDQEETLTLWPAREVKTLFEQEDFPALSDLGPGKFSLGRRTYAPQWIECTVKASKDAVFELSLFGERVQINAEENTVRCMDATMPLYMRDGNIRLLILADALGFEIFCGEGQAFMCMGFLADYTLNRLELTVQQGNLTSFQGHLAALQSVWPVK